jgi:hypothetical protein
MKESFSIASNPQRKKEELVREGPELMRDKGGYLEAVKAGIKEVFGTEKLPPELIQEIGT